jgi:acetyl esterase/lipase
VSWSSIQTAAIIALLVVSLSWRCDLAAQTRGWQPSLGHIQVPIWPSSVAAGRVGPDSETMAVGGSMVGGLPWLQVRNVSRPTLTVYSPKGPNTSAAVIVFPGGGYQILAIDLEGTEVCDWLNSKGITCVLLKYRVPNAGPTWDQLCGCDIDTRSSRPLEDAQRTISLGALPRGGVARRSAQDRSTRLSAGGHLVAAVSTRFERRVYPPVDVADQESCRPDFAVALYPGHLFDYRRDSLNADLHVTRNTPPTFLVHAQDDNVDGPSNSLFYYIALKDAGVPAELHMYAEGRHAFGLRQTKLSVTHWPRLVEAWLGTSGIIGR